jgi:hypothetical protein
MYSRKIVPKITFRVYIHSSRTSSKKATKTTFIEFNPEYPKADVRNLCFQDEGKVHLVIRNDYMGFFELRKKEFADISVSSTIRKEDSREYFVILNGPFASLVSFIGIPPNVINKTTKKIFTPVHGAVKFFYKDKEKQFELKEIPID